MPEVYLLWFYFCLYRYKMSWNLSTYSVDSMKHPPTSATMGQFWVDELIHGMCRIKVSWTLAHIYSFVLFHWSIHRMWRQNISDLYVQTKSHQHYVPTSNFTGMEVSAFSECFLSCLFLFSNQLNNKIQYSFFFPKRHFQFISPENDI